MALFGRRRGLGARRADRGEAAALRRWIEDRSGVEAYVEPATSTSPTTVVLVAGDGEWVRRQVRSAASAADLARKAGIPVYDTNRVGYPQRMREYSLRQEQGRRRRERSSSSRAATSAPSAPRPLGPAEREAIVTLQVSAGVEATTVETRPSQEQLRSWWRTARSRSHPDRRGGDRTEWDDVERAASVLDLA